jgi:hypothetical protein
LVGGLLYLVDKSSKDAFLLAPQGMSRNLPTNGIVRKLAVNPGDVTPQD